MLAQTSIGFIGLGAMGGAIAQRLQNSGLHLHVHDIDEAAVGRRVAAGATAHKSPRAVADHAEVVIACLPSASISEEVALGDDGVVHGTGVRIYIECSTIGRAPIAVIATQLAAREITLIDAPVSGGPRGAERGTLSVMASGPDSARSQVMPILSAFGAKVFEVGPEAGMAQMMKLVNNLVSATNMASAFEAVVLGAKAGLDAQMMVDVLNASTGRNSATETKLPQAVLTGTFDYGARVDIIYKDVQLGLQEAELLGVPMWVAQNTGQMWRHAMCQGAGPSDFTTLIKVMEAWAGVTVRAKSSRA
jgi:3-hydroxyisobutyrate dehydrogenase-like beta-hydroxyacid dehydrogenase